jgi:hypothetical protein
MLWQLLAYISGAVGLTKLEQYDKNTHRYLQYLPL